MKTIKLLTVILMSSLLVTACAPGSADPISTPVAVVSPTETSVPTPTSSPTATPRPTGTPTATATSTPTVTPSPTCTASPTSPPTKTPRPAATVSLTLTSTATGPAANTPSPQPTAAPKSPISNPQLPPGRGDYRFGVVDAFDNSAAASQLGAGWTRLRFQWSVIQPNDPAQWNDADLEAIVNSELAAGREVAGLIVNTPPWALKDGAIAGVPRGMELPADNPENVWAQFVRTLVTKYAGRVNHWIIWNEPDIWDNTYPGQTWGGSVDDFLQFQRVAYTVAKAANSNAVIHLAGFTFWWDSQAGRTPFFSRFLDALAADPNAVGNNYYFDVVTSHQYFRPDTVYDLTLWHHGLMRGHGFDKPIWIVETNAAPSLDPAWPVPNPTFNVTLDDQAAFIVQSFAMGLAAGAERIAVYKMADTPGDKAANPEPFGLVRMDGTRRPAFAAYQLAARYLAGFRSATLDRRDDVVQVTVDRGDQTTTVLWSRAGSVQHVTLPARAATALVVDSRTGGTHTQSATNGQYTLDLPGASCTQPVENVCLVGGWPILVIEQNK